MEEAAVTVGAVTAVGQDAIALEFETPPEFDARPGQFVKLVITAAGEDHSRFYTISSPTVGETFELTVEIDPDGDVSPQLRELEAGDEVELSGPYGNAYYEDEASVLVIAGGPGVGPAVGIAERTLDDGGEVAVVYRDEDPIHRDRLDALADRGAFVRLLDADESLSAHVEAAGVEDRQVFVYGFADFLDGAMDAIAAAGGKPDEAKVENFG